MEICTRVRGCARARWQITIAGGGGGGGGEGGGGGGGLGGGGWGVGGDVTQYAPVAMGDTSRVTSRVTQRLAGPQMSHGEGGGYQARSQAFRRGSPYTRGRML